jgi:DnaJ like chaperone protein
MPGQRRKALATLGLSEGASKAEIHEAFKQLARKYHPDRVAHLGPELIELTSEKFKEISEAHDLLTGKGRGR